MSSFNGQGGNGGMDPNQSMNGGGMDPNQQQPSYTPGPGGAPSGNEASKTLW